MGVTLSGSQGLSSPQANGYVSSMDLTLSGPRLDADFLVADSKFMKVAFGVGFKMIAVPSSGIVTTSRYVVPTGRVKVPAGRYVVPTGKDNVIVSAGRTKVIPAGSTILVLAKGLQNLSSITTLQPPSTTTVIIKVLEEVG
ncbi:hypothetical protein Tco_0914803 [Tanacetum coccineum]